MLANLKNLSKNPEVASTFKMPTNLKVAALTQEMCKSMPQLLKYFTANGKILDRFHIPEIDKETYERIALQFKQTARFNKKNLVYETASQYYIRKARVINLAEKLGVKPSFIDVTDYIWDERYYTCYNFWDNVDEVDEAWKSDVDERLLTGNQVYIDMDTRQDTVDMPSVEILYDFCQKCIDKHIAMLIGNVDKCLNFLDALTEFTQGFTTNCTKGHNATLVKYLKYFTEMAENKEFQEFVKEHDDITVFADCASTHADFIETYARFMARMYTYEEFMEQTVPTIGKYTVEVFESEYFKYDFMSGAYLNDLSEEEDVED